VVFYGDNFLERVGGGKGEGSFLGGITRKREKAQAFLFNRRIERQTSRSSQTVSGGEEVKGRMVGPGENMGLVGRRPSTMHLR